VDRFLALDDAIADAKAVLERLERMKQLELEGLLAALTI